MAKADKPEGAPAKPTAPKPGGGGKPGGAPARGGKGGAAAAKAAPAPAATAPRSTGEVPPRLRERYRTAIVPALMQERGYRNPHQAPRLWATPVGNRDHILIVEKAKIFESRKQASRIDRRGRTVLYGFFLAKTFNDDKPARSQ